LRIWEIYPLQQRRLRGDLIETYKILAGIWKTFFSAQVCNSWNSVTQHVIEAQSTNSFKNRLDKYWPDMGAWRQPLSTPTSSTSTNESIRRKYTLFWRISISAGDRHGRECVVRSKTEVDNLLSLQLKLLLLLLLLLDKVRVQFSGARNTDDGCTEVADGMLSHCRQRSRLLTSLRLRTTVKIERYSVYTGV